MSVWVQAPVTARRESCSAQVRCGRGALPPHPPHLQQDVHACAIGTTAASGRGRGRAGGGAQVRGWTGVMMPTNPALLPKTLRTRLATHSQFLERMEPAHSYIDQGVGHRGTPAWCDRLRARPMCRGTAVAACVCMWQPNKPKLAAQGVAGPTPLGYLPQQNPVAANREQGRGGGSGAARVGGMTSVALPRVRV